MRIVEGEVWKYSHVWWMMEREKEGWIQASVITFGISWLLIPYSLPHPQFGSETGNIMGAYLSADR